MNIQNVITQGTIHSSVTNNKSRVDYVENTPESSFEQVAKTLLEEGYIRNESGYTGTVHRYEAFLKDGEGVFVNYFKNTSVLSVAYEKDCAYFDFADNLGPIVVKPQITQIHLEDFGMSYAIRLSDGRYIVIDGGREFEPDAQRLYNCLKEGSPFDTPVIAAWIFTHPHSDHFHCFIKFFDMYQGKVDIERFLYYFPERDDELHYPRMKVKDARFEDSSPYTNIALM